MFIGIAGTIPNLPNLPGQGGGGGVEVLLEYDSSSFCKVTNPNLISPTVAEPAGGTFSYTGTGTLGIVPSSGLINVFESDSGSYTITYSVGGSSSSFPIAIGNEIILSITTSPGATICTGDTATLTANASGGSGGFTYSWDTSPVQTTQSIDVSPTTTTTYTVTVTDSDNCSVSAVQQITASTAGTAISSINNDAAMAFNGVDSYVDAGNDVSLQFSSSFTISAWVNIDLNDTGNNAIISKDSGVTNGAGYHIDFRNGNSVHAWSYDASSKLIATGLTTNTWYHIVFIFESTGGSNGNQSLYINAGTPVTNTITNFAASTIKNLRIGESEVLSGFNTDGKIDEVAIWDSALSSCDVKGIYEGSIGSNAGKAANLLDTNTTIPAPVYWNRMGDS